MTKKHLYLTGGIVIVLTIVFLAADFNQSVYRRLETVMGAPLDSTDELLILMRYEHTVVEYWKNARKHISANNPNFEVTGSEGKASFSRSTESLHNGFQTYQVTGSLEGHFIFKLHETGFSQLSFKPEGLSKAQANLSIQMGDYPLHD